MKKYAPIIEAVVFIGLLFFIIQQGFVHSWSKNTLLVALLTLSVAHVLSQVFVYPPKYKWMFRPFVPYVQENFFDPGKGIFKFIVKVAATFIGLVIICTVIAIYFTK